MLAGTAVVSQAETLDHKGVYSRKSVRRHLTNAWFNHDHIRSGYAVFCLNMWARADKQTTGTGGPADSSHPAFESMTNASGPASVPDARTRHGP